MVVGAAVGAKMDAVPETVVESELNAEAKTSELRGRQLVTAAVAMQVLVLEVEEDTTDED